MRLIDADELEKKLPNDLPYKASVKRVLIQAPTIDAEPVRHGKWTTKDVGFLQIRFVCSACGKWEHEFWHDHRFMKYCPNCGAKMDGD